LLANYTKTRMKGIPYFEQTLNHLEKLIEALGKENLIIIKVS
jgi:hypothetical protein